MILESILYGSLIPATLAGILLLAVYFLRLRPINPLILPAAFLLGFYNQAGVPSWPPPGSDQSLAYVVALSAFWPLVEFQKIRWFERILALLAAALLILKPLVFQSWDLVASARALGEALGFGLILWLAMESSFRKSAAPIVPALSVIVGTGLSLVLVFHGSALLANMAGTYCAVAGALAFLSLLNSRFLNGQQVLPFFVLGMFSLALMARFFLDAKPLPVLALALPFTMVWWRWLIPLRPKKVWAELLIQGLIAFVIVAAATYWSFLSSPYNDV